MHKLAGPNGPCYNVHILVHVCTDCIMCHNNLSPFMVLINKKEKKKKKKKRSGQNVFFWGVGARAPTHALSWLRPCVSNWSGDVMCVFVTEVSRGPGYIAVGHPVTVYKSGLKIRGRNCEQ